MNQKCKSIGCSTLLPKGGADFCVTCRGRVQFPREGVDAGVEEPNNSTAPSYPEAEPLDVFAVHQQFELNDPSGSLHHASRLILLSCSEGGSPDYQDIEQARDVITRWLQLNKHRQ